MCPETSRIGAENPAAIVGGHCENPFKAAGPAHVDVARNLPMYRLMIPPRSWGAWVVCVAWDIGDLGSSGY